MSDDAPDPRTVPGESRPEPGERSSRQVWRLGSRVLAVQLVTMILLWLLQAVYA